jgi:hypothetical protein
MDKELEYRARAAAILRNDLWRLHLLDLVANLGLPDCWIAAGFVRNAVWDDLHDRPPSPLITDVDVIWFDPTCGYAQRDRELEASLLRAEPSTHWSVKNQARMHTRNADAPYTSATDAMRYWPETATAVAARLSNCSDIEIASPLGLEDLFGLVLRPAGRFATEKREIYENRVAHKQWLDSWSLLRRATD